MRVADHMGKCKANYTGSAPSMETEGVQHISSEVRKPISRQRDIIYRRGRFVYGRIVNEAR